MWLPTRAFELFHISQDTVSSLREELAQVKAERNQFRDSLSKTEIVADWLRLQVNALQYERCALLEKAYGIKTPVPELTKAPAPRPNIDEDFSFDDIGDRMAKQLGFPIYDKN